MSDPIATDTVMFGDRPDDATWVQHRDGAFGYGHPALVNCHAECGRYTETTYHNEPPPLSWETDVSGFPEQSTEENQ